MPARTGAGAIPDGAIEDYAGAADAALNTSELERFGLSILETMFHGKPVVAFRVGGIPEAVGEFAMLWPFADVPAFAAVDSLLGSPELARELGGKARNRAQSEFSAGRTVPRYEMLYRQCSNERQHWLGERRQETHSLVPHLGRCWLNANRTPPLRPPNCDHPRAPFVPSRPTSKPAAFRNADALEFRKSRTSTAMSGSSAKTQNAISSMSGGSG